MAILALLFYKRRADVSPAEFERYMIENHIPLLMEVMEQHSPQSYTVRFVARVSTGVGDRLGATTSSTSRAEGDAPVTLIGSPEDIAWDAQGEMVFRDELHLQQALALMDTPGGQRVKEDEGTFTESDKLSVVLMGREVKF